MGEDVDSFYGFEADLPFFAGEVTVDRVPEDLFATWQRNRMDD